MVKIEAKKPILLSVKIEPSKVNGESLSPVSKKLKKKQKLPQKLKKEANRIVEVNDDPLSED